MPVRKKSLMKKLRHFPGKRVAATKHPKRLELRAKISAFVGLLKELLLSLLQPRKDFLRWNGWVLEVLTPDGYKPIREVAKERLSHNSHRLNWEPGETYLDYQARCRQVGSQYASEMGWNYLEEFFLRSIMDVEGRLVAPSYNTTVGIGTKLLTDFLTSGESPVPPGEVERLRATIKAYRDSTSVLKAALPYVDKSGRGVMISVFWDLIQVIYKFPRNTQGLQLAACLSHLQHVVSINDTLMLSQWAEENKDYWPKGLLLWAYWYLTMEEPGEWHPYSKVHALINETRASLLARGMAKSTWRWLLRQKPTVTAQLLVGMRDERNQQAMDRLNDLATACNQEVLALKAVKAGHVMVSIIDVPRRFHHERKAHHVFIRNAMKYMSKTGHERINTIHHIVDWMRHRRAALDANILELPIHVLSERARIFFERINRIEADVRMAEEAAFLGVTADDSLTLNSRIYYKTESGVTVKELVTIAELNTEGEVMHHCVAGYARAVLRGDSRIFSISRMEDSKEIRGTLEVGNGREERQFRSYCNAAVEDGKLLAARDGVLKMFADAFKGGEEFSLLRIDNKVNVNEDL